VWQTSAKNIVAHISREPFRRKYLDVGAIAGKTSEVESEEKNSAGPFGLAEFLSF
jgi:hypothetical protein